MRMTTRRNLPGRMVAAAGVVVMLACQPADEAGRTGTIEAGGDVARPDTGVTATGGGTGAMRDLPETDAGIINVVMAIDRGELEAARLAQERSQNAQVRAFASEMINDHSRDMRQLEQLAEREDIEGVTRFVAGGTTAGDTSAGMRRDTSTAGGDPSTDPTRDTGARAGVMPDRDAPTGVMTRLESSQRQLMTELRNARGATFDQTYVRGQVRAHEEALDILRRLEGQAHNAALQQHLTEAMAVVERHLARARELEQNLRGATTTPADTGRTATPADTGR